MRREVWARMRPDLIAAGVPHEAWPRRLPRLYNLYDKKSQNSDVKIQVLLAVRKFKIIWPKDERGYREPSTRVHWDSFPDVAAAWDHAKQLSGW